MNCLASSVGEILKESPWFPIQCELLDRQQRGSRTGLGSAIFRWIGGFYKPRRRHTALGVLSPPDVEPLHTAAHTAA